MSDEPIQYTPFIPNEHMVKRAYVLGMRQAFIASTGEHEAEFERFLAHIREAAVKGERARIEQAAIALAGDTIGNSWDASAPSWHRIYPIIRDTA